MDAIKEDMQVVGDTENRVKLKLRIRWEKPKGKEAVYCHHCFDYLFVLLAV